MTIPIPVLTWSSLLVCRSRCRKKSSREHFLTRMRSVVPSARWAEGDRPLGLRGHAQLIQAALMARNFPLMTVQPSLPSEREQIIWNTIYAVANVSIVLSNVITVTNSQLSFVILDSEILYKALRCYNVRKLQKKIKKQSKAVLPLCYYPYTFTLFFWIHSGFSFQANIKCEHLKFTFKTA